MAVSTHPKGRLAGRKISKSGAEGGNRLRSGKISRRGKKKRNKRCKVEGALREGIVRIKTDKSGFTPPNSDNDEEVHKRKKEITEKVLEKGLRREKRYNLEVEPVFSNDTKKRG